QSCKDQRHASELNPSWQPLSKIFTPNYSRNFASLRTISRIRRRNALQCGDPALVGPLLKVRHSESVLWWTQTCPRTPKSDALMRPLLIRFCADRLSCFTGATN